MPSARSSVDLALDCFQSIAEMVGSRRPASVTTHPASLDDKTRRARRDAAIADAFARAGAIAAGGEAPPSAASCVKPLRRLQWPTHEDCEWQYDTLSDVATAWPKSLAELDNFFSLFLLEESEAIVRSLPLEVPEGTDPSSSSAFPKCGTGWGRPFRLRKDGETGESVCDVYLRFEPRGVLAHAVDAYRKSDMARVCELRRQAFGSDVTLLVLRAGLATGAGGRVGPPSLFSSPSCVVEFSAPRRLPPEVAGNTNTLAINACHTLTEPIASMVRVSGPNGCNKLPICDSQHVRGGVANVHGTHKVLMDELAGCGDDRAEGGSGQAGAVEPVADAQGGDAITCVGQVDKWVQARRLLREVGLYRELCHRADARVPGRIWHGIEHEAGKRERVVMCAVMCVREALLQWHEYGAPHAGCEYTAACLQAAEQDWAASVGTLPPILPASSRESPPGRYALDVFTQRLLRGGGASRGDGRREERRPAGGRSGESIARNRRLMAAAGRTCWRRSMGRPRAATTCTSRWATRTRGSSTSRPRPRIGRSTSSRPGHRALATLALGCDACARSKRS